MASSLAMRDLRKAIGMRQIHQECLAQESCLGTFAFMWGWKFEHTPTWFSTFNEPWFKGMTGMRDGFWRPVDRWCVEWELRGRGAHAQGVARCWL